MKLTQTNLLYWSFAAMAGCLSAGAFADTDDITTERGHKSFDTADGRHVDVRGVRRSDGEGNVRGSRAYRVTDEEGNVIGRGRAQGARDADGSARVRRVGERTNADGNQVQRRARAQHDGEGNSRAQRQTRRRDADGDVVARRGDRVSRRADGSTQRRTVVRRQP